MAEVFTKYVFDTTEASASLSRFKQEVRELQGAENSSQKTFQTNAQKRAQLLKEEQQDLIELRKRRDAAYTTKEISLYNKRIAETEKRVRNLKGEYGNLEKGNKSLINSFKKVGAAIGLTFGVSEIIRFTEEAVKLSAEAEGIRTAFERIGGTSSSLQSLQRATRNTISEVELMQKAVEASNFDISLTQLAGLFEFATNRALETGASVQQLTDDIVIGLGRRSLRRLDNLGLKWDEMRESAAATGDFTQGVIQVINSELAGMGDIADTTATKMDRANAKMANSTVAFGDAVAPIWADVKSVFGDVVQAIGLAIQGQGSLLRGVEENIETSRIDNAVGRINERLNAMTEVVQRGSGANEEFTETFDFMRKAMERMGVEADDLDGSFERYAERLLVNAKALRDNESATTIYEKALVRAIPTLEDWLERLKDGSLAQEGSASGLRTIASIQEEIKEKQERMNTEVAAGSAEFHKLNREIIALTKEMEGYLKVQEAVSLIMERASSSVLSFGAAIQDTEFSLLRLFQQLGEGTTEQEIEVAMGENLEKLIKGGTSLIPGNTIEQTEADTERIKEILADLMNTSDEFLSSSFDVVVGELDRLLEAGDIAQEVYDQTLTYMEERLERFRASQAAAALGAGAELVGVFKDIFTALAKDSAKNAQFLNALTTFQILLNQAQALSSAIASAKGVTAVDYAIQVAIAVATVVGAIAKAKSIQNQARPPTAPRFAYGGEIYGKPHTQGGVHIEAERGEYIVKSSAYAKAKEAVHAINSERFDTYVTQHYIEPLLKSKQLAREDNDRGFARNIAESLHLDGKAEHYLKQIARKGNNARIENFDELARLMRKDNRGSTY